MLFVVLVILVEYKGGLEGESLSCQLHFRSARRKKKKASAQGSLKFREVSNTFWKVPGERKPV